MTNTLLDIRTAAHLLGGEAHGNRVSCPGPGHSKKDRSLSVTFTADGFLTNSFAGDDFRDCRDHVKARLGLSDEQPVLRVRTPDIDMSNLIDLDARIREAARLWETSVPIEGTLAEVYLRSRDLTYSGSTLRFRAGCRSMVALMTDALTGEPCGVQRTFLDASGNKVDRKMKGRARGAVVRLHEWFAGCGIGIAEGIETALATGFEPMWACLSAGTMKSLPVVRGLEVISIFADHDRAGIDAANTCGERWHAAGCEVIMAAPTERGSDFAERSAA